MSTPENILHFRTSKEITRRSFNFFMQAETLYSTSFFKEQHHSILTSLAQIKKVMVFYTPPNTYLSHETMPLTFVILPPRPMAAAFRRAVLATAVPMIN